jgi:16S rRNA G527 N7-methylase RsmG
VVGKLGLEGVEIIQERAELRPVDKHRQNTTGRSRAVAVMPVLVEYLLPLVPNLR